MNPSENNSITVSQLNGYIASLISSDDVLNTVAVRGEISNFKAHYSGHLYFSLKDQGGRLSCVMFAQNAASLDFEPKDGDNVVVYGYVGVYEKSGSYQLYSMRMKKSGMGELYERYTKLLAKLESEGFLDPEHKQKLPYLPKRVALVTSPTGAAVRDLISVIRRRCPITQIIICPVLVQGAEAAGQIASMIDYINQKKLADVIIAARGGGAIEELWAFNELVVAQSIYNSDIPIISGVGHETDFTICDFVSDVRAATPSAAAEFAVPEIKHLSSAVGKLSSLMSDVLLSRAKSEKRKLELLSQNPIYKRPSELADKKRMAIDQLSERLYENIQRRIDSARLSIKHSGELIGSLSGENILKRGYFAVKKNGTYTDEEEISLGDSVSIISATMEFAAVINSAEKRRKNE